MKVKVATGSHLVYKDKEYKAGETLELDERQAEVQLNAGIVVAVEDKKLKKEKS